MLINSKGSIFYGMHFYPGVAEYSEPGKEPYRVFLNEATLRSMDPSFAGRPIFVQHVDSVDEDVNELRKDADGWVVESFFNQADGKHWVKFIAVSDRALAAIKSGMKLSNAYVPETFANGGQWNGVSYDREITGGEFEHLAIVSNPRYEESVIMTPEQFKRYNDNNVIELKRLANSKEKTKMKLAFWEKKAVKNDVDFENMSVTLPLSKKEMTIGEIVNALDKVMNMHGYASDDHMVKVGENEMSVKKLVAAHKSLNEELEGMKKKNKEEDESEVDMDKESVEVEGDKKNEDDEDEKKKENEDEDMDDEAKAKKKKDNEDEEKEKKEKKENAKKKADALKNAHLKADIEAKKKNGDWSEDESAKVEFMSDQVARGKKRYGS